MSTTSTTATQPKAYNIAGVIGPIVLGVDRKDREYGTFTITRSNGKTMKCIAFAEHIEKVKEAAHIVQDGEIRLFGVFNRRQFKGSDGKDRTALSFRVLWAGAPKAKSKEADEGASLDF
ncbi:hypothetical protein [Magnetospirillum sp. ME-1]|uniref:hypothetical protein n=1 Tax=Magnetospirillum sp. ME-1 TaxID=1639348 RepID=UPI0011AE7EF0|nr:hypothetical protein [Magnetospirillum sp. ME-1]